MNPSFDPTGLSIGPDGITILYNDVLIAPDLKTFLGGSPETLSLDPVKLRFSTNGAVFYGDIFVAGNLPTFVSQLQARFAPGSDVQPLQRKQQMGSPRQLASVQTLSQYRSEVKSSSSDHDQQSSSDSNKSLHEVMGLDGGAETHTGPIHDHGHAIGTAISEFAETNIDRVHPSRSRLVTATPGRLMTEQVVTPDVFYGYVAKYEKPFREASVKLGKRKSFGVDPEDIVVSGAIHCVPCRPSNLDNNIHSILRFENFNDTLTDVYEQIKPALRLASKMITDRRLIPFWTTLALGKRVVDHTLSPNEPYLSERIPKRVQWTAGNERETLYFLNRLSEHIHWTFRHISKPSDDVCYGFTQFVHRDIRTPEPPPGHVFYPGPWKAKSPDPWEQESVISLSKDYYTVAKRLARTRKPEAAMRLRYHFSLAIVICHEIAHAFEQKCGAMQWENTQRNFGMVDLATPNYATTPIDRAREAVWLSDTVAEMGWAWERDVFGGRILPINGRTDTSLGMVACDNWTIDEDPNPFSTLLKGRPLGHTVPMAYIEEIQQQTFWDRPRGKLDEPHKLLRVPRSGAKIDFAPWVTGPSGPRSWLQQRDCEQHYQLQSITDTIGTDLTSDHPQEPASKRRRISPDAESMLKRPLLSRDTLIRLSKRQPKIDKYILKQEQDLEQLQNEAVAAAEKAAQDALAAKRARQEYVARPRRQQDIHDFMHYIGSDRSSGGSSDLDEDADRALKEPHKLTVEDKWLLCEEYLRLFHGKEEAEFLALRIQNQLLIVPQYHPEQSMSWQQEQLDELLQLRRTTGDEGNSLGGNSFYEDRRRKRAEETQRRQGMKVWQEMEELAVLTGHSRIEFHKARAAGTALPDGMSFATWDDGWRAQLHAIRKAQEYYSKAAYQSSLKTGAAYAPATGALAAVAASTKSIEEASGLKDCGRITDYFRDGDAEKRVKGRGKKKAVEEVDTPHTEVKKTSAQENATPAKDESGSDTLYEEDNKANLWEEDEITAEAATSDTAHMEGKAKEREITHTAPKEAEVLDHSDIPDEDDVNPRGDSKIRTTTSQSTPLEANSAGGAVPSQESQAPSSMSIRLRGQSLSPPLGQASSRSSSRPQSRAVDRIKVEEKQQEEILFFDHVGGRSSH